MIGGLGFREAGAGCLMRALVVLIISLLAAGFCAAQAQDFGKGIDAYNKGDFAGALAEWKPLAGQGDAKAQYMLGQIYRDGKGVKRDYKEARKWFEAAASQGHPSALYWLGWMYEFGKGMWLSDRDKALKLYIQSAEAGYGDAQLRLGEHFVDTAERSEDTFPQWTASYQKDAFRWFMAAAQKGKPVAQVWVGFLYEEGFGVEKDYGKAMAWYQRASKPERYDLDGNLAYKDEEERQFAIGSALAWIGGMYQLGQGVPRDTQIALKYYMEAAGHGSGNAMSFLGTVMEAGGDDMPRDPVQAYMWFTLAKQHCWENDFDNYGLHKAETRLDELEKTLTPEQIAQAKSMAAEKHFPMTYHPGGDGIDKPSFGLR
jgi:uncharacterized protein